MPHDSSIYIDMIKRSGGKLHILGNFNNQIFNGRVSFFYGKNMTSSNVGGIYDTQEMINFCAKNNIQAQI